MATRKLLNSLVLTDADSIETWLDDLQIWKCVTDLEKKQQGPVIYLSLPDNVRNSCRNISITDLNKDDGLDTLINNLERLYLKDKKALAYLAYEKFESFQRPTELNIIDYINKFERLYHEIQQHEMTLPAAILAYCVLKSANISSEKQQLGRATITELNYENMKNN